MKRRPITLRTVRRRLRRELNGVLAAQRAHRETYGPCLSSCEANTTFLAQIAAYKTALKLVGARVS